MSQSTHDPVSYRRRSALEARPTPAEFPCTLEAGVLAVFPDANPKRLGAWLGEALAAGTGEAEPLLFLILLAGIRLRIGRAGVVEVFEDLWTWLTSPPRRMPPALAELIVEAVTPELRRAIERRGWRFGPGGDLIKRQGRPPETRAAWTAALLAENCFATRGAPGAKAKALATSLAAVLLGRREVELPEFYRARRRMGVPDPTALVAAISDRYEDWLSRHAGQLRDPEPPEGTDLRASWRERHRPLAQFVGIYGAEEFARLILEEIPEKLWAPFSGVAIPRTPRALKPKRDRRSPVDSSNASPARRNSIARVSVERRRG